MYVEARSTLARARRARRLTPSQLRSAVDSLDALSGDLVYLDVEVNIVEVAGGLAERFELRGYDAVHLASALAAADRDLIVVTADDDLRRAAAECGLAVALLG